MKLILRALPLLVATAVPAAAAAQLVITVPAVEPIIPRAAFEPERDAMADVDAALAAAQASGRHVMIIFGGDWCHDSRALADLFAQERFATMLDERYHIVRVHVPRASGQRSIAAGQRFGLGDIVGTPTVLILTPDGRPINLADAPRWRNAASRKPDAIHRHFARAVPPVRQTAR